jgi:BMFP domain-containing protein YqiC
MLNNKLIDDINKQLSELISQSPLKDAEKNIKALILAVFNKLDLVTREEFDTQQKILLKTKYKLDELEQKIKQLMHEQEQK